MQRTRTNHNDIKPPSRSECTGQYQPAAIPLALCIVVEEVTIEASLDEPADPADPVHVVLCEVSVDPVQDVEGPVGAHAPYEVRGEVLHLPALLHQYKLGEDGYAFQPDGHRPEHVCDGVLVAENDAEHCAWSQEVKFILEGVVTPLVGLAHWGLVSHQVDQKYGGRDEDDLHDGVVERHIAPEEVEIPAAEDQCVHFLHSAGDSDAALASLDLEDQEHNTYQMQHVAA
mmetsp:Transcript_63016/g.133002  ORF Transcript_63016/g.133002 Transcript_63016/m.133002 type:complete len:229 (-) Transcript_63016:165-851(-)|eukprot:CAMPEP_0206455876 /NCGR_PEP_ID=MMETSP0324_2-20121206/22034_1 /ASSEMBLY_ACC=CAM_ASM_000836 /TAXON_ID=2866 /ORGANISM="Crypthecodinium cohnii, Strain Seligo" /LENGTH=228 /DNA_ID=CAMNT_0053926705 /DNA_START=32 /DNA_END=718 /DNA_ORIENTATION=-